MPKPLRILLSLASSFLIYFLWVFGLAAQVARFDGTAYIPVSALLTLILFGVIIVSLIRVMMGDTKYYFYTLNSLGLIALIIIFAPRIYVGVQHIYASGHFY